MPDRRTRSHVADRRLEPAGADGQRPPARRSSSTITSMWNCCGTAGSGQVAGRWSGASWKPSPDVLSFAATTTKSALGRHRLPEQLGVKAAQRGRVGQCGVMHPPDHRGPPASRGRQAWMCNCVRPTWSQATTCTPPFAQALPAPCPPPGSPRCSPSAITSTARRWRRSRWPSCLPRPSGPVAVADSLNWGIRPSQRSTRRSGLPATRRRPRCGSAPCTGLAAATKSKRPEWVSVVAAFVAAMAFPQCADQVDALVQHLGPRADAGLLTGIGQVRVGRAEAEDRPRAAGDLIERRDLAGHLPRPPPGQRRQHRAEADPRRPRRDRRENGPRIDAVGQVNTPSTSRCASRPISTCSVAAARRSIASRASSWVRLTSSL